MIVKELAFPRQRGIFEVRREAHKKYIHVVRLQTVKHSSKANILIPTLMMMEQALTTA